MLRWGEWMLGLLNGRVPIAKWRSVCGKFVAYAQPMLLREEKEFGGGPSFSGQIGTYETSFWRIWWLCTIPACDFWEVLTFQHIHSRIIAVKHKRLLWSVVVPSQVYTDCRRMDFWPVSKETSQQTSFSSTTTTVRYPFLCILQPVLFFLNPPVDPKRIIHPIIERMIHPIPTTIRQKPLRFHAHLSQVNFKNEV